MNPIDFVSCAENSAAKAYAQSIRKKKVNPKKYRFDISWARVKSTSKLTWRVTEMPNTHQIIYIGNYSNPTESASAHMIKCDTATDAVRTITLDKGLTTGLPLPVSVELPEDVTKATNVFGNSIKLDTNLTESADTEKIKWAVDSQVPSPPKTKLQANVEVTQKVLTGSFDGTVSLQGTLIVNVFNRKNNALLGTFQVNIHDILDKRTDKMLTLKGQTLTWDISGSFKFVFGITHEVSLSESKIGQSNSLYPNMQEKGDHLSI